MTQKLIFFDIDGTLLNEDKQLPDSTREAIGQLQASGHIVALATGRAPFAFRALMNELNIHSYVSINGQYVVHNDEAIYTNPLQPEGLIALKSHATAHGHPLMHMTPDDWYTDTPDDPHIIEAVNSLQVDTPIKYQPDFHLQSDIYQTLLFCTEAFEQEYEQAFQEFEFIRWHPYSMDVVPAEGSKAIGISKLVRQLQMPESDIYAFGDGLNDIKMLKAIPNSIAMGNADDIVKKAAGSVTRDVSQDGIWHGLKQAGLL